MDSITNTVWKDVRLDLPECGLTSLRRNAVEKIPWHGLLTSVQPRIRLGRSFDQRSHTYLGYALRVRGNIGREVREFLVGAPIAH